jgi:hypothetical protein
MPTNATPTSAASEVSILSRLLLNGRGGLTRELAQYFLSVGFTDEDNARMHELAVKNQESQISPEELRELDGYVKAGDLLAILQAKARKLLQTGRK